MEDRGTSPPPDLRRQSTAMSRKLVDHPVVGEYLKAYEGVLSFKENLSRIMQDRMCLKNMMRVGTVYDKVRGRGHKCL